MKFINGYRNEDMFIAEFNNKYVKDLSYNMRLFLEDIDCSIDDDTYVRCYKGKLARKADLYIILNRNIYGISLKNGFRNSIHGESLKDFCYFMKKNGIADELINYYKFYHFGDGTYDGSGSIRKTANECKLVMNQNLDKFNKAVNDDNFIISCVSRFIIGSGIDFIIDGTIDDFIYLSKKEIYELMLFFKNKYMSCPHISLMCVQPKMRCLDGSNKKGRYDIQVKWYNIYDIYLEFINSKYM